MTPTKAVRLHVYEGDDPEEISMRFMIFLLHQKMVHLTDRDNV